MQEGGQASESKSATTLSLGEITCHVISDGAMNYALEHVYPDAPQAELSAGLAGRLNGQGELPLPYRCVLVETPTARVLIDTGLGPYAAAMGAPAGRLLDNLIGAGFSAADVDVVVLTHAHPDHIGGLIDAGRLVFPDARHVMSASEWNHWTSQDQLARMPEVLAEPARAILPVVGDADVLDLIDGESEVVPGVRLVPAPGHTIGHCVVMLESGGEQAVFLADSILDELQLTHPSWVSAFDMLPEETVSTRTRLLDEAERDASLVLAYHVSGVGHVERRNSGYALIR